MASASFASGQDEFARHAELAASFPFVERHRPRGGGDTGLLVREPVGVVGAIIPWNGPSFSIAVKCAPALLRSEEHTSELQSLMRISYAVFCLKNKHSHTNAQTCHTT